MSLFMGILPCFSFLIKYKTIHIILGQTLKTNFFDQEKSGEVWQMLAWQNNFDVQRVHHRLLKAV